MSLSLNVYIFLDPSLCRYVSKNIHRKIKEDETKLSDQKNGFQQSTLPEDIFLLGFCETDRKGEGERHGI